MDTRAPNPNPLLGLREKLLQTADRTKKPHIDKLQQRAEQLSQRYAEVASAYAAACQSSMRRQDNKLSPEAESLQLEKQKLEKERDEVRLKLRDARAAWLPELRAATAPLLGEVTEVVHQALLLIESAQPIYEAFDKYLSANGHLASSKLLGRSLESQADTLRRFLERAK